MKPLGWATLKKALGRNTRERMPESTQPVTRCHFGTVSVIIMIAPRSMYLQRALNPRPAVGPRPSRCPHRRIADGKDLSFLDDPVMNGRFGSLEAGHLIVLFNTQPAQ